MVNTKTVGLLCILFSSSFSLKPNSLLDQLINDQSISIPLLQEALLHGLVGMTSFGGAVALTGYMLEDTPFRWASCKQAVQADAADLAKYAPATLSKAEVNTGILIQAMSHVPQKCWRELTCLPIIYLLFRISFKEFNKFTNIIA
jgi:hypothetical protein